MIADSVEEEATWIPRCCKKLPFSAVEASGAKQWPQYRTARVGIRRQLRWFKNPVLVRLWPGSRSRTKSNKKASNPWSEHGQILIEMGIIGRSLEPRASSERAISERFEPVRNAREPVRNALCSELALGVRGMPLRASSERFDFALAGRP